MRYTSASSFRFTDGTGNIYNYNGVTGEVTGPNITDPIKYMKFRVDESIRLGSWKVLEENKEFPRAGVHAKLDSNLKVFVVGLSTQKGFWAVEYEGGALFKVRTSQLSEIKDDDSKAFDIARDLNIGFNQAMQMVKKGYGKL